MGNKTVNKQTTVESQQNQSIKIDEIIFKIAMVGTSSKKKKKKGNF